MEPLDGAEDTVHPEVRAHINSLASALGGTSVDDDGQYQLGDDALQVLRDIKRWIRFYDEKTNRMDVARCIYEANLVQGDLLPILAQWPESAMDNKFKSRMALACFEVLVPLTWPMDRDEERMTVNHHRHMPVLELAQLQYKNAIINFDGARILHMAVRAALPSMAISNGDRTARDQGIIKLVLFFLRNVALISPPSNMPDEAQISIVATIDAFSCQDIFIFLLTLASNMGDDFRTEDATVMEIIHHLVKRVEVDRLFMEEQQLNKATASQLSAMMSKESSILNASKRKGPTRHNRFGTMIWVKRDDGKMSSLSGQDALADAATRIQKMDSNKTFKPPRPPRRGKKQQKGARDLGPPVKLKAPVNARLRSFVEEFLDSGFNRLFQHVRKSIDREAPHLMIYHRRQFFRLVAWFLEAEHARRQAQKRGGQQSDSEVGSFNLIAGVLNQEMFITLSRALHESYEMKDWQELAAVMRCFTQILLTVQEMADSGHDDDGEIAENVLGRLFYEEATHDAIANIAKTYKDQGFDYLDAATELVHNFLRILEAYSKQNVDMQVRTRRRTRRKKQAASQAGETAAGEESDGSANDVEKAADNSKDRKFNFRKFSSKFTQQGVVDTFTTWTKHYRDLNDAQLKRAHRYFYRVAFKQEMSVMLFRVDILHLLHSMIRGPEPLDKSSKMFKEWEELVRQILRKCFKKMQERPELIVEMLFSKIPRITSFLEFGHEIQTAKAKREAKPGAELEFRHTEERDRQVAIVIGAMLDRNESDHINWVKGVLTKAESERRSWAAAHEALPPVEDSVEVQDGNGEPTKPPIYLVCPDDTARRTAMFKNSYLRLLMTLCGLARLGPVSEETPESCWVIPDHVLADDLKDSLHYINQAEFSPPTFEDGAAAEKQLKRKTAPRKKAVFDDGDEDAGGLDDDIPFPIGGPTARRAVDEPAKPKKTRQRRRRRSAAEEPDDAELAEKARKRREREREKARRVKSAMYVREGDDDFDSDEDEAFFARERAIAQQAKHAAQVAVGQPDVVSAPRKRKSDALLALSSDDDDDDDDDDGRRAPRSREDSAKDGETDGTPPDASDGDGGVHRKKKRRTRSLSRSSAGSAGSSDGDVHMEAPLPAADDAQTGDADAQTGDDDAQTGDDDAQTGDDDAHDTPVAVSRRPRVRGGLALDIGSSDDDE